MDSSLLLPTSLKHINEPENALRVRNVFLIQCLACCRISKNICCKMNFYGCESVSHPEEDNNLFPQIHFSLLSWLLFPVFVYSQSISLLRCLQPGCIRCGALSVRHPTYRRDTKHPFKIYYWGQTSTLLL